MSITKYQNDKDLVSDLIDYFIFTTHTLAKLPKGATKDNLVVWINKIRERLDLKLLPDCTCK